MKRFIEENNKKYEMVNSLEYDYKSQANNKSMFETPKLKQSQSYYKYDDNKNTLKNIGKSTVSIKGSDFENFKTPNTSYNPITNPLPSLNQNPYIHTPGKSLKNQRLYKASNIDKMMHERYRNLSVGSLQPRLSYS